LDEPWFVLADEQAAPTGPQVIPQLWHEKGHAEIHVNDGRIKDWDVGIGKTTRSVYGGVQMEMQQFQMQPQADTGRMPMQEIVVAPARISRADLTRPSVGFHPSRAFVQSLATSMPQGVDLSLDSCNLSEPREDGRAAAGQSFPSGEGFWSNLDGLGESAPLLKELFHPCLSDRRAEGVNFIPPDSHAEHLSRLRELLLKERALRLSRVEHFRSDAFTIGNPGQLFPSSWRPSVTAELSSQQGSLRHVHLGATSRFERVLKSSTPVFDNFTEDGARFRLYRVGGCEIRTIQEHGSTETIVAVYSGA